MIWILSIWIAGMTPEQYFTKEFPSLEACEYMGRTLSRLHYVEYEQALMWTCHTEEELEATL